MVQLDERSQIAARLVRVRFCQVDKCLKTLMVIVNVGLDMLARRLMQAGRRVGQALKQIQELFEALYGAMQFFPLLVCQICTDAIAQVLDKLIV